MTDSVATFALELTGATEKATPEPLSAVLLRLSRHDRPMITIRDIAIALQDRSFGAFLLIFALPNLVPAPPGATLVLGLPLIFVTWQMLASAQGRIYLPRRIGDYGVTTATFQLVVNRLAPWLKRAGTLVKPRFWLLGTRFSERLLGLFALVLAVVVFLPIPLGNWLPALAIIGFAHSQCDGFGVLIGVAVGAISLLVASFVVYTAGAVLFLVI
ncbi:MAG: exopolysaccharide biosynthesis protein [Rhizobium sp.]|nr:exopolysaccharide biosynthesis protein [Rhizobium sp.]